MEFETRIYVRLQSSEFHMCDLAVRLFSDMDTGLTYGIPEFEVSHMEFRTLKSHIWNSGARSLTYGIPISEVSHLEFRTLKSHIWDSELSSLTYVRNPWSIKMEFRTE